MFSRLKLLKGTVNSLVRYFATPDFVFKRTYVGIIKNPSPSHYRKVARGFGRGTKGVSTLKRVKITKLSAPPTFALNPPAIRTFNSAFPGDETLPAMNQPLLTFHKGRYTPCKAIYLCTRVLGIFEVGCL